MGNNVGWTTVPQNKKGAPRKGDEAESLPKSATRSMYDNPAKSETPSHGTPREKL